MFGSTYSSTRHCAPLERQTVVSREVYKDLAPLEPEHFWLWPVTRKAVCLPNSLRGMILTTTLELKSLRKIICQTSFIVPAA